MSAEILHAVPMPDVSTKLEDINANVLLEPKVIHMLLDAQALCQPDEVNVPRMMIVPDS